MVKDGRDNIKTAVRPCFRNDPSRSAIQKEKEKSFREKKQKVFMEHRIFSLLEIKTLILNDE